jgi:hypothetical protein
MNIFNKYIKYKLKYLKSKFDSKNQFNDPIFEIYQYNILNYEKSSRNKNGDIYFTNINESIKDCPTFAAQSSKLDDFKDRFAVCDIITDDENDLFNLDSVPTFTESNMHLEFHKYLYYIHRILKPKYFTQNNIEDKRDEYPVDTIINMTIIDNLIDKVMKQYDDQYIQVYNVQNKNDKFIIMGDFHGGIHSFIRILFRLHKYNILDITTMKLKDNYHLIFLGDIIDRGMFGTEILAAVLLLIVHNHGKIIFIAGNHETGDINNRYGFDHEILFKYGTKKLYLKFNTLFKLLPVAVLLHEKTRHKTIWLSHGCFNATYDYNLPQDIKNVKNINARNVREIIKYNF